MVGILTIEADQTCLTVKGNNKPNNKPNHQFSDLQVLSSHLVTAPNSANHVHDEEVDHVQLALIDTQYPVRNILVAVLFVFQPNEHSNKGENTSLIDGERMLEALRALVAANPMLAGRFATGGRAVACTNAGLPFVVQRWPSGKLNDFPACIKAQRMDITDDDGALLNPSLPLVQDIDFDAMDRGEDAFLKVTLTQLGDGGSVVGFNISHAIADGGRYHQLMSDICTAYHASELKLGAYMDRSSLDFENILACVEGEEPRAQVLAAVETLEGAFRSAAMKSTDLSADDTLRETFKGLGVNAEPNPSTPLINVAARTIECLRIPKAALDTLRAGARARATAAGFNPLHAEVLSNNDVVSALHWMMRQQMNGWPLPGEDGDGSVQCIVMDISRNLKGFKLLEGYMGNAMVPIPVGPATDIDIHTEKPSTKEWYLSVLTRAACAVRTGLHAARNPIAIAIGAGLQPALNSAVNWPIFPEVMQLPPVRSFTTNWCGYDLSKMDFGSGQPSYVLGSNPRPWCSTQCIVAPCNVDGGGVCLIMPADEPRFSAWRASNGGWVEQLAPGVKWL